MYGRCECENEDLGFRAMLIIPSFGKCGLAWVRSVFSLIFRLGGRVFSDIYSGSPPRRVRGRSREGVARGRMASEWFFRCEIVLYFRKWDCAPL